MDTTIEPTGMYERVIEAARSMMRVTRVPRRLRDQLVAWAKDRMDRGADPAEVEAMILGQSTLQQADGTFLADATGASQVLRGTVPEVAEEIESGSLDEDLEAIREVEVHGGPRVGVMRAIDARVVARDIEQLVMKTVRELDESLQSGDWDTRLDKVLEAEKAEKNRRGALKVVEQRKGVVRGLSVLEGTVADLRTYLDGHPDAPVAQMIDAERAGKNRKTALDALESAAVA